MRKIILLISILLLILSFSCQYNEVYPDYNKYRLKTESLMINYSTPLQKSYYEYIYNHNFEINEIIHYDNSAITHKRKFKYSSKHLEKILYYNSDLAKLSMKDSIVYNSSNKIQAVFTFDHENKLTSKLEFQYDEYKYIEKCMKDGLGRILYVEKYFIDKDKNVTRMDRYYLDWITNELTYSFSWEFKYDTWVNPYYKNGFVGSLFNWPISANNVIERVEIVDDRITDKIILYYEYLESGYPYRTNYTLKTKGTYIEYGYESVR